MPYVPFIHPDSNTVAYRHEPLPDPDFVFSDGHTSFEIDAIHSQNWPIHYRREYLQHFNPSLSEEELHAILYPPRSTETSC